MLVLWLTWNSGTETCEESAEKSRGSVHFLLTSTIGGTSSKMTVSLA